MVQCTHTKHPDPAFWGSAIPFHMKQIATTAKLAILLTVVVLSSSLSIAHADAPAPPQVPLRERPIEEIVTHFSIENGIEPSVALAVMGCESHGIQSTVGDHGLSLGIFQIQKATWKRFTKEMGEDLDISSPYDQARVATWAMGNGHSGEWTTYVALTHGGKYTFWYKLEKKEYTVYCKMTV